MRPTSSQPNVNFVGQAHFLTRASGYLQTIGALSWVTIATTVYYELVKLRLAKLGLTIASALDGCEAVALVKTTRYDLILMDIQMPNLNGVQATRQIRQLPNGLHVPILATPANANSQERGQYFEAGMTGFIAKPFVTAELLDAVYRWVNPP